MNLPDAFAHLPFVAQEVLREAWDTAVERGHGPAHHLTENSYVAVTGGREHLIAVHVHPHEFSIALDAAAAERACRSHASFNLENTNLTTKHVHVQYAEMAGERDAVVELVLQAIERSWRGGARPRGARGAAAVPSTVAICPSCHEALPATLACDRCD
jgi:hypothetical protein